MLQRVKVFTPIFCLIMLLVWCASLQAADMQAIKAQMLQRKPTVDALKKSGAVGEGADGYLHVRQAAGNAAAVAKAENDDRRAVNQMIASKEGTTVDQVSRKVAATISKNAQPGHWVQKPDGTWYQK